MNYTVQGQSIKIIENFFLNGTDEELYGLLQEVLKRPLMERCKWDIENYKRLNWNYDSCPLEVGE